MIKRVTLITILLFFIGMVALTIFAKPIHMASLPKVTVTYLQYESFNNQDSDGSIILLSLPKELYKNNTVYILVKGKINGDERDVVRAITNLELVATNDTSYGIKSGISGLDKVIMTGMDAIENGSEVYVQD